MGDKSKSGYWKARQEIGLKLGNSPGSLNTQRRASHFQNCS
jgi:hypothetical protein